MEFENRNHRKTDIVKDIIFFFLTTVFAFAYFMLVLLIISFITTSYHRGDLYCIDSWRGGCGRILHR